MSCDVERRVGRGWEFDQHTFEKEVENNKHGGQRRFDDAFYLVLAKVNATPNIGRKVVEISDYLRPTNKHRVTSESSDNNNNNKHPTSSVKILNFVE